MRVAREGVPFIVIAAILAAGGVWLARARGGWPLGVLAAVLVVLALWVVYFFRDPEREGPRGDRVVIAPADGRVVSIAAVDEPAFLAGPATRVSIFMNVFNVHVNRYPVSGTVRYVHYNPGKFLNAASDKASLDNEQLSVGIETAAGRVLVRQIAGLIARRIANYARMDASVVQGERMGLIRFGSRVDVFLPPGATVRTRLGERTAAGTTVIAELAP